MSYETFISCDVPLCKVRTKQRDAGWVCVEVLTLVPPKAAQPITRLDFCPDHGGLTLQEVQIIAVLKRKAHHEP